MRGCCGSDVGRRGRRVFAGNALVHGDDRSAERNGLTEEGVATFVVESVLGRRVGVRLPRRDGVRGSIGCHAVECGLQLARRREHRRLQQQALVAASRREYLASMVHDVDRERRIGAGDRQPREHPDSGRALTEDEVEEHILGKALLRAEATRRLREAGSEAAGVAVSGRGSGVAHRRRGRRCRARWSPPPGRSWWPPTTRSTTRKRTSTRPSCRWRSAR